MGQDLSSFVSQLHSRVTGLERRDDHAHARIDALQKVLAKCLSDLATDDGNATEVSVVMDLFKAADRQVEKKLGLR